MSKADANQAKLIQAHDTAKVAKQKPTTPTRTWSSTSACASSLAAVPNAITNARSKSSSSGVAARWTWATSRPVIRTMRCDWSVMAGF